MSDAVTPFQAPIGTHDVLGPSSAEWEGVVATFAQFAFRYGFELVITPMFEDVGVFNRGIGEESEVAKKEMYVFSDRGERVYALRPEGTRRSCAPSSSTTPRRLEGLVRDAGVSLRTSPGRALSPAPPTRRRSTRAPTTGGRRGGHRPGGAFLPCARTLAFPSTDHSMGHDVCRAAYVELLRVHLEKNVDRPLRRAQNILVRESTSGARLQGPGLHRGDRRGADVDRPYL